jgi:hypothetical protein
MKKVTGTTSNAGTNRMKVGSTTKEKTMSNRHSPFGWQLELRYQRGYEDGYAAGTSDMRKAYGQDTTPTEDEARRLRAIETGEEQLQPPGNRWLHRELYSTGRAICLHDGQEDASDCPFAEDPHWEPTHIVVARFPPEY